MKTNKTNATEKKMPVMITVENAIMTTEKAVEIIDRAMVNVQKGYIVIAGQLARIEEIKGYEYLEGTPGYEGIEYTSITDFASKRFGISSGLTSKLVKIGKVYGQSNGVISDDLKALGQRKLYALAELGKEKTEKLIAEGKVNADMTAAEVEELVKLEKMPLANAKEIKEPTEKKLPKATGEGVTGWHKNAEGRIDGKITKDGAVLVLQDDKNKAREEERIEAQIKRINDEFIKLSKLIGECQYQNVYHGLAARIGEAATIIEKLLPQQ